MTENESDGPTPSRPPLDEVQDKRIGRVVRRSIEFREEVFSRGPDSIVQPDTAAAILGLRAEELTAEMDEGRLGYAEVDGQRVIRVADLQAAFDQGTARLDDFSKGWTELRSKLDWDE